MKGKGWLLLPGVAVAFDVLVVASAVTHSTSLTQMTLAIITHLAVAVVFSALLSHALRRLGRDVDLRILALGASLSFFVPVFGGLALLGALFTVLSAKVEVEEMAISYYKERDLLQRQPPARIQARRPPDRLVHVVRSGRAVDDRFEAVLAAGSTASTTTVSVLKAALADSSEEVRLSAFSKIETTTRTLELKIRDELKLLEKNPTRAQAHLLHATLAQLNFHIAFLGLAEGEVFKHTLKTAAMHAEKARTFVQEDPQMLHLMGRVAMLQAAPNEHVDTARAAFNGAMEEGLWSGAQALDRADEAFRRRDFRKVTEILASSRAAHDDIVLGRLQEFWK